MMVHSEVWPHADLGGMRPAGWNNVQRCTCGYEAKSRAEVWKHAAEANADELRQLPSGNDKQNDQQGGTMEHVIVQKGDETDEAQVWGGFASDEAAVMWAERLPAGSWFYSTVQPHTAFVP